MITWLTGLLNTPRLQLTTLQEIELSALAIAVGVVVFSVWAIITQFRR